MDSFNVFLHRSLFRQWKMKRMCWRRCKPGEALAVTFAVKEKPSFAIASAVEKACVI